MSPCFFVTPLLHSVSRLFLFRLIENYQRALQTIRNKFIFKIIEVGRIKGVQDDEMCSFLVERSYMSGGFLMLWFG